MAVGNDRNNEKDSIDPISISTAASRPLLIFNHNPKAGGGSILKVIRGFKSRELKCSKWADNAESYGSGCSRETWKKALTDDDGVDKYFLHVREKARTTAIDHQHGFVIGSIREPCSQYLSLWSFGSLDDGGFRRKSVKNSELYGISPPYFNTTVDKKRFSAWMRDPKVVGLIGRRVKQSYGESVLDRVDCWVYVEDFQDTLLGCLRMYQDQGGFVDWRAPTVAALLEKENDGNENENEDYHHHKWMRRRKMNVKKDDPLGDPRLSHHGKCQTMFDTATAQQVEESTESFVYEFFGYEGCCKPGGNFRPMQLSSLATKETTTNHYNNMTIAEAEAEAANYATDPTTKESTQQQQQQQLDVSSVHSVRVGKVPPTNNNEATVMTSSKPSVSKAESDWHSFHPTTESYDGHSIDVMNLSATMVMALATMAVVLVFYFNRLFSRPRSEETRY